MLRIFSTTILCVFLLVTLSCRSSNAFVAFSASIWPTEKLHYGETLQLIIEVEAGEYMQNTELSVYVPVDLDFTCQVKSRTCKLGDQCAYRTTTVESTSLLQVDRMAFDDHETLNAAKLTLVDADVWQIGHSFNATLNFMNMSSNTPKEEDFVVAMVKFWNKHLPRATVRDEEATQKKILRWYRLIPVWLDVLVNGERTSPHSHVEVYLQAPLNLTISMKIDERALPVQLSIEYPHRNLSTTSCAGLSITGQDMDCSVIKTKQILTKLVNSHVTTISGDLTGITATPYSDRVVLTVGKETASFMQCHPVCSLNLSLQLGLLTDFLNPGDYLSPIIMANYGENYSISEVADTATMVLLGPDLTISVLGQPSSNLQAGDEVDVTVDIRHSQWSTEPLTVMALRVEVSDAIGVELLNSDCQISHNRQAPESCSMNITRELNLGQMDLSDTYEIHFKLLLNDELLIGTKFSIQVIAEYTSATPTETAGCMPQPCQHGGICVSTANKPKCLCSKDFAGDDCSKRVCKEGWTSTALDTCYYFPEKMLPFDEAKQECDALKSTMVSLDSVQEIEAFNGYMRANYARYNDVWLGLQATSDGKWSWPQGALLLSNQTRWANGQSVGVGQCVVASANVDWQWKVVSCSQPAFFACSDRGKDGLDLLYRPGEIVTRHNSLMLQAKRLLFSSVDLGLTDRLGVHQPLPLSMTMELPFGSLQNISIMIEFASDQVNQLPIRFVNSLLSFDPAVQLSRPDLISIDRKTFASPQLLDTDLNIINGYDNKVIIQLRRKRSLTTEDHQMRLTRIVGDITNPKSAGVSNAKFGIQ
uniref:Uncharacterized protein n=1 Tax=Plectus sambesii TaxID=2011161 RepID=A0A914X0B5_9BILA